MWFNFPAAIKSHPNIWLPDAIFAVGLEWHDHCTHTIFRLRGVFQIKKIISFRLVVLPSTNACVSEKYPPNNLIPVFFYVRLWFAVIQKRRFSWGDKLILAAFDTGLHSSWNPLSFRLRTESYDRRIQVVKFSFFSHLIVSSRVEYSLITIRLSIILWSPRIYVLKRIDSGIQKSIDIYHRIFSSKVDNEILNSLTLYKCRVDLMIYKELLWTGR